MKCRKLFHELFIAIGLLFISAGGFAASSCQGQDQDAQSDELTNTKQALWIEGEPRQLTFDGRMKNDPVFVDGGKSIVYASLEKFNQLCLMKLALTDQSKTTRALPQRFHPSATTSELMVTFARDPKVYSYLRNNGNLHFEIVMENQKEGTTVKYNPGGGFAGVRNVSLHPDGSHLLFAFPDQNGPQQIRTLSRDGKTTALLTNSEGINRCPRYSSDGKRVVFSSSRTGDFEVFLMNADGSNPVNVTNANGLDTHPTLSPDSKKIAFTGLRNGNYDIYIIQTDGSGLRRLTRSEEVDDYPCWSPDGKRIVWVGERNGKRDLYSKSVPDNKGSKRKPKS